MTCSCSPVYVIRIVRYRRRTGKKSAHSSSSSERREIKEKTRERSNQKTNGQYTQLTYRLWSPCSFCSASRRTSRVEHHYHQNRLNLSSLVVGVARGVVLFLLLFLLPRCSSSRSSFLVMKNCWRRKKKRRHKKQFRVYTIP